MAKRRVVKKRKKSKKKSTDIVAAGKGCAAFYGCSIALAVFTVLLDSFKSNPKPFVIIGILLLVVIIFINYLSGNAKRNQLNDISYQIQHGIHIDMTGEDYEQYVAKRLLTLGYKQIRMTKASGDHGADIIAVDPNGISCAIQCKYYSSSVGNKAVQEALSGSAYYGCQRAIVITNNDFTRQAIEDANRIGVELISRF